MFRSRWSVISKLLALLLLGAAVLKFQGLSADPVARMGIFSSPEFQLAAVEFEIFLAVWLLWGTRPLGAWRLALATFACFAAVSFYQGWIGESSCGCFGRLSVSPWSVFAVDMVIFAALSCSRPQVESVIGSPGGGWRGGLVPAAWFVAGMVLIGSFLLGLTHVAFGSLPGAIAYFRGERVSIEPRLVDVGRGERGESREVTVTLTNWTDEPVRVFGATADCSFIPMDDLPVRISPKESRAVSVRIELSGKPGIFTRKGGFVIDDQGFKKLTFRMTGRITASSGAPR